MARTDRVKPLAEAVAAAFESAGYSPAELLQGPIRLTDLSWQAPPLCCKDTLGGVPLNEYLDYPLATARVDDLYDFYALTLFRLAVAPEEAALPDGYRATARLFPGSSSGERKLALALPEGWPTCEGTAGAFFALEMAHVMRRSLALEDFKHDDSTFAAHCGGSKVVGIVNGVPTECADQWDVDCSGAIEGMLEQPRGKVTVDCLYDTIARLRSALHEEPQRFKEFMGLDYALQALRILADGGISKSLQTAIQNMSLEAFKRKQKIAAYEQAIEVMQSWNYPDRAKVSMLLEILVPACLSFGLFCRKIYNPSRVAPAVLQTNTERRILLALNQERDKLLLAQRAAQPEVKEAS